MSRLTSPTPPASIAAARKKLLLPKTKNMPQSVLDRALAMGFVIVKGINDLETTLLKHNPTTAQLDAWALAVKDAFKTYTGQWARIEEWGSEPITPADLRKYIPRFRLAVPNVKVLLYAKPAVRLVHVGKARFQREEIQWRLADGYGPSLYTWNRTTELDGPIEHQLQAECVAFSKAKFGKTFGFVQHMLDDPNRDKVELEKSEFLADLQMCNDADGIAWWWRNQSSEAAGHRALDTIEEWKNSTGSTPPPGPVTQPPVDPPADPGTTPPVTSPPTSGLTVVEAKTWDQVIAKAVPGAHVRITASITATSQFRLNKPNIIIECVGDGKITRGGAAGSGPVGSDREAMFVVETGAESVVLEKLQLYCNGYTAVKIGAGEKPENFHLNACSIFDSWFGLLVEGDPFALWAIDNKFGVVGKYGWFTSGGRNSYFISNTVNGSVNEHACRMYGLKGAVIKGNTLTESSKSAIWLAGSNQNVQVIGNTINGYARIGYDARDVVDPRTGGKWSWRDNATFHEAIGGRVTDNVLWQGNKHSAGVTPLEVFRSVTNVQVKDNTYAAPWNESNWINVWDKPTNWPSGVLISGNKAA